MNCPTCGSPNYSPPWKQAREAGYDQMVHCALMANQRGKLIPCLGAGVRYLCEWCRIGQSLGAKPPVSKMKSK